MSRYLNSTSVQEYESGAISYDEFGYSQHEYLE